MTELIINPDRLWRMIQETAAFGATEKGGLARLALGESDRRVRDWFRSACETLGCTVRVDAVGNMFATLPGRRRDALPIAMGSHLDTQRTGGKFDGILGVLAGLEVLHTLADAGRATDAPLMVINWTNEEGARFAPAMLGSGVYAGLFDRAFADTRSDADGVTFAAALEAIGYRGADPVGAARIAALFELHIEQGPILESHGTTIGIVEGVQAMRWFDVTVEGRSAHAGTTPFVNRRDAMLAAAELVTEVARIGSQRPGGLGTVGFMNVHPNARNTVPGKVSLSVDLRHPDDRVLDSMEQDLAATVEGIGRSHDVATVLQCAWTKPAIRFDAGCIAAIERAAAKAGARAERIVSGAGHDAANIAVLIPTAMIFIPCAGGLSHNELEAASQADCAAGAQVLLNAVIDYDAHWRDRQ